MLEIFAQELETEGPGPAVPVPSVPPDARARNDEPTRASRAYPGTPTREPGEPAHEYHHRLLACALEFGIAHDWTVGDLEGADAAAAYAVAALPKDLNADQQRLDSRLHTLRLEIAGRLPRKRAGLTAAARLIDQLYQDATDQENAAVQADGAAELEALSPQERAGRMLAAAIVLLSQGGDQGGGGRGARLQPPSPTRPPGGNAIDPYAPPRGRF